MITTRLSRLAGGRLGDSLLPMLLGVAATLGFPPTGWYGLSLLAPAGLLWLWRDVSPRRAAWRGFVFGFAHFLTGFYWVSISIHRFGGGPLWLAGLLAVAMACYIALYPTLVGYVLRRWFAVALPVQALLVMPLLWLLAELVRGTLTGFPWLSLGNAFIDTPLARLAPLSGVHGMSAVVVLLAGAVWLGAVLAGRLRWLALAVWLSLPLLYLLPAPGDWTQPSGEPIAVSLVQGNIPQELKWSPGHRQRTLAHYRALSEAEWGRRLVIWPEVAIPALRHQVSGYLAQIDAVARASGSTLLTGILVQDDPRGPLYNSVLSLGVEHGSYHKRHLVPFGEFFPAPKFLLDVGGILGLQYSNFTPGLDQQAELTLDEQVLGVSICFEDVFGDEIRHSLPAATLLVNVTNDAWFGDSSAPHQHLQMARMRALETGRTLLRVANTGISAVIGPDGRIQQSSPQFEVDVLRAEAVPRQGLTPYAGFGDLPLWVLAVAGLAVIRFATRRPVVPVRE